MWVGFGLEHGGPYKIRPDAYDILYQDVAFVAFFLRGQKYPLNHFIV